MNLEIILPVVGATLVAFCILAWVGSNMLIRSRGVYCRSKMGKACRSMAKRGDYAYFEDLTLPGEDGKPVHIDHLVLGTFGVVAVNCFDYKGDLYGSLKDQQWHLYKKETKLASLRNPLPGCEAIVPALRKVFAAEKVYNVTQIETFLVFGNGVNLNAPRVGGGVMVLRMKKAKELLRHDRYMMDYKLDPQQMAAAIQAHAIG